MPRYAMHIPHGSERPYCGAFMATPRASPRVQGTAYAPPYCDTGKGARSGRVCSRKFFTWEQSDAVHQAREVLTLVVMVSGSLDTPQRCGPNSATCSCIQAV